MRISNSDFWLLATLVSAIAALGVYEGCLLHPLFYSQPVIIFGGLGYFAYKAFYFDVKSNQENEEVQGT